MEEKTAVRGLGVVYLAILAIDVFLLVRICLEKPSIVSTVFLAVCVGFALGSMATEAR